MNIRCAGCGSEMDCDPKGSCWCMELLSIPFSADATACLCPVCLKRMVIKKLSDAAKIGGSA
ncbi:MAG: hypothetical protein JWO45_1099 [Spartobacteria bacterium]|nr:hypothetical protein [Spartobacteria bacterium]